MVQASFPEIESPSLRKSGVVLESEELRSSAIGQTSRDVGHATNLLNDEFFFDCEVNGQKTLHFGSGAGDGAPGSSGKGDGITFLCFAARSRGGRHRASRASVGRALLCKSVGLK